MGYVFIISKSRENCLQKTPKSTRQDIHNDTIFRKNNV